MQKLNTACANIGTRTVPDKIKNNAIKQDKIVLEIHCNHPENKCEIPNEIVPANIRIILKLFFMLKAISLITPRNKISSNTPIMMAMIIKFNFCSFSFKSDFFIPHIHSSTVT
jgi:hypothetical protein